MEWHEAVCGHSDEDRMVKMKDKWSPRRGIKVHLSRATWQHYGRSSLLQRIRRPRYFAMSSSINRSSLLPKCNFDEIKHFWRKILSSLRFSCIIDSSVHGLRQVNHESLQENVWKSPLERWDHNKEGIRKILSNQSNLRPNLLDNRLVVRFLRSPCNLDSLD